MRISLLAISALLAGCAAKDETDPAGSDTADPTTDPSALAIAGSYDDAFGSHHEISETEWTQQFAGYDPLVFEIRSFDNAAMFLVAENGADNGYYPGAFSRFDWAWVGEDLYACQTTFDAATAEDAEATPRADDADPAAGGCGGFGWTLMTP